MTRLQKALDIKPEEWRPVLILSGYYFLVLTVSLLIRPARSAYFLPAFNENAEAILPFIMLLIPFLGLGLVALQDWLARFVNLVPLILVTSFIFAVSLLVVEQVLQRNGNAKNVIAVFYGWADVISTMIFAQFWLLAGLIFDARQAKRLFSVIGVAGAVGSILIAYISRPLVKEFGAEILLILLSGLLGLCMVMVWLARPYIKTQPHEEEPQKQLEGPLFTRYLKTLAVVLVVTTMAASLIEYQTQIIAKEEIQGQENLATFFTTFYMMLGVISLFVRVFLINRILSNGGILAGVLLLPIMVAVGSAAMFISPELSMMIFGATPLFASMLLTKGADQVLRYTINDTAIEVAWVPIDPQRKIRTKGFVNGVISSAFKGLVAITLIVLVGVLELEVRYVSLIVLGLVVIWIPAVFMLRKGYVDQLLTSIQKRQLKVEDLRLDIRDNTIVQNIRQLLQSAYEPDQAFGLELIHDADLKPWYPELRHLFEKGSIHIKQNILHLAADLPTVVSDAELMKLIYTDSGLTDEAILIAAQRKISGLVPLLERYLDDDRPEIRAAAAKGALVLQQGPVDQARRTLELMLRETDTKLNTLALNMLVDMPAEFPRDLMKQYLHRNTTHVVKLSLAVAKQLQSSDNGLAIADIAYNLRRPRTAYLARQVLKNYPASEVITVLLSIAGDASSDRQLRIGIISMLRDYPDPKVVAFLVGVLADEDIGVYSTAVNTLLEIARLGKLAENVVEALRSQTNRMAQFLYKRYQTHYFLQASHDKFLLDDLVSEDIQRAKPTLLKLTVMNDPSTPIETVIYNLEKSVNLGNALEFLDNIFDKEERTVITPLFENIPLEERCVRGYRFFDNMPRQLDEELNKYIQSNDNWRSMVALDYAIRHERVQVLENLNWKEVIRSRTRKDMLTRFLVTNGTVLRNLKTFPIQNFPENARILSMYSTLEKTILLKHVDLFQNIPARDISHLAQIAREVELKSGETLFSEGDPGEDMYVIAYGKIRIYTAEGVDIIVLEKGQVLGEMAILDREPRSASATALEDTMLLRITRIEFFELMASRIEIMEGIIQMLTLRLRGALILTQTNIPR